MMIEPFLSLKRKFISVAIILLPVLLLVFFRLFPGLDKNLWPFWQVHLANYYLSMLAGFMALVAALFTAVTPNRSWTTRTFFLSCGFFSFGWLLLMSSLFTPGIILNRPDHTAFVWPLYISYLAAGFFFALAGVHWSPARSRWLIKRCRLWGAGLFLALFLFALMIYANPEALSRLRPYGKTGQITVSVMAFLTLLWAAWRTYHAQWEANRRVTRRLVVAMGLMASVQVLFVWGAFGYITWLLYLPLTVLALVFALAAILVRFKDASDVPVVYYFAALGSIFIAAISLASAEASWFVLTNGPGARRAILIPLSLAEGALSFFLLFGIVIFLNRLITERTQALRQEQRKHNELTQLIIHDLKSPVTVILSGMNLLAQEQLGELTEAQKRLLVNLEQSGQGILHLIDDLLDVERLEEGILYLNQSTVNLARLLEERVESFQVLAGIHQQTLSLVVEAPLPDVRVDKRLLERLLNNLIANALKFTPAGGEIQVSATAGSDSLDIWVMDSGPGVPAGEREKIFEKFIQVKGYERRGAGLGLTFCRMVAEAHGGTLVIEDSPLGGAAFHISLPYDELVVLDEGLTLQEFTALRWPTVVKSA